MKRHPENIAELSMLELFRMEADYQLKIMDETLIALETNADRTESLDVLMRGAHSIKGAARMVDANAIVQLSHALEDCFIAVKDSKISLDRDLIDVMLNAVDMMHLVAKQDDAVLLNWSETNRHELDEMLARLAAVQHGQAETIIETRSELDRKIVENFDKAAANEEKKAAAVHDLKLSLQVDTSRINKILGYAGESLVESHRFNQLKSSLGYLKKRHYLLVEQIDALSTLLDDVNLSEVVRNKLKQVSTTSLRLRQEFAEQLAKIDGFDRRNTILMERLHKEVLNTRMRPFSSLVQGWPRLVRDLGKKLDKEVRLEMSGLATLVDREVLERIDVPLKHIIQNAIDHGIEHPDERIKKEKSRIGAIILRVHHSAGQLLIQLQDDGAGVDISHLKKKIVKKGLASADKLDGATQDELLEYLFVPGFSTRDYTTEISGRGVGLDLVKDAIVQLNGTVRIASEQGIGTKFELTLPLTVSIIRTLVVQLGGEQYGVPMARIHRIMSLPLAAIKSDIGYFVDVEGKRVDLVHGNTIFDMPYNRPQHIDEIPVIIFQHGEELVGWVVEAFIGEHELAVQKIDPMLGKIPGIKSSAVRQDGIIVLMVDSEELLLLVDKRRQENKPDVGLHALVGSNAKKRVLVVDQSRSSRERLKRLLTGRGYDVLIETMPEMAVSMLNHTHVDAVVWGVEDDTAMLENDTRLHALPMLFFTDEPRTNANANLPWHFLSKVEFQSTMFLTYMENLLEGK